MPGKSPALRKDLEERSFARRLAPFAARRAGRTAIPYRIAGCRGEVRATMALSEVHPGGLDLAVDLGGFAGAALALEIVKILEVEPKFGVGLEIARQAQGGFRSDAAALVHDFSNARGGDVQLEGEFVYRQAKGLHEIFAQDFSRVHGRHQLFRLGHNSANPSQW